jgi:hypothetical protein
MFIIASSGRAGTYALCTGLDRYSDHRVRHEPPPLLLDESFAKHRGEAFETDTLRDRFARLAALADQPHGESFRAVALLPELHAAVPTARFLVLVRDPLAYVRSAHAKRVFRKRDSPFDRTRLMPEEIASRVDALPLAEKIAWHWVAVNRHCLDFAEAHPNACRVLPSERLEERIPFLEEGLGVRVEDPAALRAYLLERPNAGASIEMPEGYDEGRLLEIAGAEWARARSLGERDA